MARYEFTITIIGQGETVDSAWEDAVTSFSIAPERPPVDYKRIEDEEE